MPGEVVRFKLLKLCLDKYIAQGSGCVEKTWRASEYFQKAVAHSDILRKAAAKTKGFWGREIAKLVVRVEGVYGSEKCVLDPTLFREVVDYKVAEHQKKRKLAAVDRGPNRVIQLIVTIFKLVLAYQGRVLALSY